MFANPVSEIITMSDVKQSENFRIRLKKACLSLREKQIPITRKALAAEVGCSVRTVSTYKEVWAEFAEPYENAPGPKTEPIPVEVTIYSRLCELKMKPVSSLSNDELTGYMATTVWSFSAAPSDRIRILAQELNLLWSRELHKRKIKKGGP